MLGYEGFIYTLDRQTEAKMIFAVRIETTKVAVIQTQ